MADIFICQRDRRKQEEESMIGNPQKHVVSLLAFPALFCLFLPLTNVGYDTGTESAIGWLSYWRSEDAAKAVGMIAMILCLCLVPLFYEVVRGSLGNWLVRISALASVIIFLLVFGVGTEDMRTLAFGSVLTIVCIILIIIISFLMPAGRRDSGNTYNKRMGQPAGYVSPAPSVRGASAEAGVKSPGQQVRTGIVFVGCGAMKGTEVSITHRKSLMIGSDPVACELVLSLNSVSRRHCLISFDAVLGNFVVTDISTNGTYRYDGWRFPKAASVIVRPGTILYLGARENIIRLR